MLLGLVYTHVKVSSVRHSCRVGLNNVLRNFVDFWCKMEGRVSVPPSECLTQVLEQNKESK